MIKDLGLSEVLFKMPFIETNEREGSVDNIAAPHVLGMSHQKTLNGSPFRAQFAVLNQYLCIYPFWSLFSNIFFPNLDQTLLL